MTKTPRIHAAPCRHCPNAHYPPTPDTLDIEEGYRAGQVPLRDAVFDCGWRPGRLCRGVCDRLGVTEADVADLETWEPPGCLPQRHLG